MKAEATCPRCRSRKVLWIRYGYGPPPAEGEWLGGCEIEEDSPDWRCSRCSFEWADERVEPPDRVA
jgi:predicted Zn-ribbon and HTH transcriptional regulator